jgi:large subunit ribosomal protein L29
MKLKVSDMRALEGTDLHKEVLNRKRELMELRFQSAIGQLANPSRVKILRREVAQLLTIQGQNASSSSSSK